MVGKNRKLSGEMETIVDKLEDMHELTGRDMTAIWKLFGQVLVEILDIVKKTTKVRKSDKQLQKPVKCNNCDRTFLKVSDLETHLKTKHESRPKFVQNVTKHL